jgi:hypothetical protein
MNTNDLPPAAKLAALIEAGRAAHPGLAQCHGAYFRPGAVCALGYAGLALGATSDVLLSCERMNDLFMSVIGMKWRQGNLLGLVSEWNDGDVPLEEIITSLREGELAKVPA